MPKVLISDELSPAAIQIFQERGIDVVEKTGMKPKELAAMIGDFDGLALRSASKVTPEVLAAAKQLKVVGRAGIGVDNIDVKVATARGICVMNTPFGNSTATAEHAITLMMAVARQLGSANSTTHEGKWLKNKYMGVEVTGKVLGIIGCGNISGVYLRNAKKLRIFRT